MRIAFLILILCVVGCGITPEPHLTQASLVGDVSGNLRALPETSAQPGIYASEWDTSTISPLVIECTFKEECPTPGECSQTACTGGVCDIELTAVGAACNNGVGVCQADHSCKDPIGACLPWIDTPPAVCATNKDCMANECAPGWCDNGICAYLQYSGGICLGPNNSILRCNWGACCELPSGVCQQPTAWQPKVCSRNFQCDDGDTCTYDSCEQSKCRHSKRPDGTYCMMRPTTTINSTGEGQCLSGACCDP